ncbi:MAG: hypothetical protein NTY09_13055, partial [bacterium]|nr:hypothetical protein [bacterium]
SPYITEELHAALHGQGESSPCVKYDYAPLIVESWPGEFFKSRENEPEIESGFSKIREFIRVARNLRKTVGLADSKKIREISFSTGDKSLKNLIMENEQDIASLLKAERIKFIAVSKSVANAIGSSMLDDTVKIYLPIDESFELGDEIAKLQKEVDKKRKYMESISKKLNDPNFSDQAPAKVIEKEREKLSETEKAVMELEARLKLFKGAM